MEYIFCFSCVFIDHFCTCCELNEPADVQWCRDLTDCWHPSCSYCTCCTESTMPSTDVGDWLLIMRLLLLLLLRSQCIIASLATDLPWIAWPGGIGKRARDAARWVAAEKCYAVPYIAVTRKLYKLGLGELPAEATKYIGNYVYRYVLSLWIIVGNVHIHS